VAYLFGERQPGERSLSVPLRKLIVITHLGARRRLWLASPQLASQVSWNLGSPIFVRSLKPIAGAW
jgi:hypothetical protein